MFSWLLLLSVEQWVKKPVYWSSHYGSDSWSVYEVIGEPDVYPDYGDLRRSWAQNSDFLDANQFIEVEFEESVILTKLSIYETYHAGGITAIYANRGPCHGQWVLLWTTDGVQDIESSRIFEPPLATVDFPVKVVRLELDCQDNYVEIDAIKMTGVPIGPQGKSCQPFALI